MFHTLGNVLLWHCVACDINTNLSFVNWFIDRIFRKLQVLLTHHLAKGAGDCDDGYRCRPLVLNICYPFTFSLLLMLQLVTHCLKSISCIVNTIVVGRVNNQIDIRPIHAQSSPMRAININSIAISTLRHNISYFFNQTFFYFLHLEHYSVCILFE